MKKKNKIIKLMVILQYNILRLMKITKFFDDDNSNSTIIDEKEKKNYKYERRL